MHFNISDNPVERAHSQNHASKRHDDDVTLKRALHDWSDAHLAQLSKIMAEATGIPLNQIKTVISNTSFGWFDARTTLTKKEKVSLQFTVTFHLTSLKELTRFRTELLQKSYGLERLRYEFGMPILEWPTMGVWKLRSTGLREEFMPVSMVPMPPIPLKYLAPKLPVLRARPAQPQSLPPSPAPAPLFLPYPPSPPSPPPAPPSPPPFVLPPFSPPPSAPPPSGPEAARNASALRGE